MTEKETNSKKLFAFTNIDPYVSTNIVEATEKEIRGYGFISWGDRNDYPDYLLSLYKNVPYLQSVINGSADFTCGDDATLNVEPFDVYVNDKKEVFTTLLRKITLDYWIYGGFALNIVRNRMGKIACIYYLDFRNVRTDKKNEKFWYSEDWAKSYGRVKCIEYPKFEVDGNAPSSIVYVKNTFNSTYPTPVYGAATKACEILKSIDEYQINSINNGFMASYIISFNNGIPAPEIQEEIENELNEKFSGYQNAGRIMIAFNKGKDNETTVQKLEQTDFSEKYKALKDWGKEQIFTSFRANPVIFGISQNNTGFNDQDYQEGFKLFNRVVIRPAQRKICDVFDDIFGQKGTVTIKPFSIDWEDESTETNVH